MLTKEECEKALDILKEQHDYLSFNMRSNYPFSINMIKTVQDCFNNLIKEHFDNPPLKLEELKLGMRVWCMTKNIYLKINGIDYNRKYLKVIPCNQLYNFGINTKTESHEFGMYFQENCFYREVVEECI